MKEKAIATIITKVFALSKDAENYLTEYNKKSGLKKTGVLCRL
jgi:hypothetical protein